MQAEPEPPSRKTGSCRKFQTRREAILARGASCALRRQLPPVPSSIWHVAPAQSEERKRGGNLGWLPPPHGKEIKIGSSLDTLFRHRFSRESTLELLEQDLGGQLTYTSPSVPGTGTTASILTGPMAYSVGPNLISDCLSCSRRTSCPV